MTVRYVDMWLQGDGGTVVRAGELGYGICAYSGDYGEAGLFERARSAGLKLVRKEVYKAETREDILTTLRARPQNIIISIIPRTREALMVALRDERVDTVIAHPELAEIDPHIIHVYENPLELTLRTVIQSLGSAKALRSISTLCRICIDKELPIILSSAARTPHELRKPRQLAYLLAAIAGRSNPIIEAVQTHALNVLGRRGLTLE